MAKIKPAPFEELVIPEPTEAQAQPQDIVLLLQGDIVRLSAEVLELTRRLNAVADEVRRAWGKVI